MFVFFLYFTWIDSCCHLLIFMFYVFSVVIFFFNHDCCYTGTLSDWHLSLHPMRDQVFDQCFCTRLKSWPPPPPPHNQPYSRPLSLFRCWMVVLKYYTQHHKVHEEKQDQPLWKSLNTLPLEVRAQPGFSLLLLRASAVKETFLPKSKFCLLLTSLALQHQCRTFTQ